MTDSSDVFETGVRALAAGPDYAYSTVFRDGRYTVLAAAATGDLGAVMLATPSEFPGDLLSYAFLARRVAGDWQPDWNATGGLVPADILGWQDRLSKERGSEPAWEISRHISQPDSTQEICCIQFLCRPGLAQIDYTSTLGPTADHVSPWGIALVLLPAGTRATITFRDPTGKTATTTART
jgi:hypothetical protein